MKLFLILILLSCSQLKTSTSKTEFSCPGQFTAQVVCLINVGDQIIAVNTSKENVAVVLRVNLIKNIKLKYRYPFVEFLAPGTSKILLSYSQKKIDRPYAFDYDWHWQVAQ